VDLTFRSKDTFGLLNIAVCQYWPQIRVLLSVTLFPTLDFAFSTFFLYGIGIANPVHATVMLMMTLTPDFVHVHHLNGVDTMMYVVQVNGVHVS